MSQEYAYFYLYELVLHLSYWFFRLFFFSNNKRVTQSIFFDKAKKGKKNEKWKKASYSYYFLKTGGQ